MHLISISVFILLVLGLGFGLGLILFGRAKRSPSLLGGANQKSWYVETRWYIETGWYVRTMKPDGTSVVVCQGRAYHLHETSQPLNILAKTAELATARRGRAWRTCPWVCRDNTARCAM